MDENSTTVTFKADPKSASKYPFSKAHPFTMLIEVEARESDDNTDERLINFLERIGDHIEDGVVA